ncbi:NAD-dependent protein deacetylase sirtuin-2-like isoform X1 [Ruditapes philippinarum]|uniref:NAD-dependent protein deacetylase sirtuin-2-like isoform X1 n=2 Tax=Ruditapes philippinarum TaxID=129788 RepID=UPI00295C0E4F|nr:NAD-dependent protein deacetylase sirtuin-2-like isoform X1 [Ruditapes philippinarum]
MSSEKEIASDKDGVKGKDEVGADAASGTGAAEDKSEKKPSLLEQTTSYQSTAEWLTECMKKSMNISDEPKPESVLDEVSFEGIARYIKSDKCKNIVTMAGAGISTSAGIPDFRSPGSGLYNNLQKYNLPHPQAIFDIGFFHENPEPFFTLCKDLFPESYKPTPCHYFIKLLEKKKKLMRHFTQNIDTLERVAGLSNDKNVEAHGSFNTGHCLECGDEYSLEWMKEQIFSKSTETVVPKCIKEDCDGVVKPDIVFFGESLPQKFAQNVSDLGSCDCLIVMGTSLVVQPFASLTSRTKETTPRLYINLENTSAGSSDLMSMMFFGGGGFDFDKEDNIRDVFWQGTCDDGCYALADLLGWGEELRQMVKEEHERLDKEKSASSKKKTPKSGQDKNDKSSNKSPDKSPDKYANKSPKM